MSNTKTYNVEGMTCGHCVMSVTEEVKEVPGIDNVNVELESGVLTVTSENPIDDSLITQAVQEAGYKIRA